VFAEALTRGEGWLRPGEAPVLVSDAGAVVAGVRIRVRPAGPPRPFPALDR